MAERWYLMPFTRGIGPRSNHRGPKYLDHMIQTAGYPIVDSRPGGFSAMPGHVDNALCLVHCPDITDEQHKILNDADDVWDIPADIDRVIEPRKRAALRRFLRAGNLDRRRWDADVVRYRDVVDEVMADLTEEQHAHKHTPMTRRQATERVNLARLGALEHMEG